MLSVLSLPRRGPAGTETGEGLRREISDVSGQRHSLQRPSPCQSIQGILTHTHVEASAMPGVNPILPHRERWRVASPTVQQLYSTRIRVRLW